VTIANARIDPLRPDGDPDAGRAVGRRLLERQVYDGVTTSSSRWAPVVAKAKQVQDWSLGRLRAALGINAPAA